MSLSDIRLEMPCNVAQWQMPDTMQILIPLSAAQFKLDFPIKSLNPLNPLASPAAHESCKSPSTLASCHIATLPHCFLPNRMTWLCTHTHTQIRNGCERGCDCACKSHLEPAASGRSWQRQRLLFGGTLHSRYVCTRVFVLCKKLSHTHTQIGVPRTCASALMHLSVNP